MSTHCPNCQKPLEHRPALFTFVPFQCPHCEHALRTNLTVRLLYNVSFLLLAVYYLYASSAGHTFENHLVSLGLAAICLPLIFSMKLPRYECGTQDSPASMAMNSMFCAVVLFLLVLWASS